MIPYKAKNITQCLYIKITEFLKNDQQNQNNFKKNDRAW